jgi:hypothetical protein
MKKQKLWCDPFLAYGGAVMDTVAILGGGFCIYWGIYLIISEEFNDWFFMSFGLFVLPLFSIAAFLYFTPVWFSRVVLDKEGIYLDKVISKSKKRSYSEFPIVKVAYYTHFITPRYFLVLSSRGINTYELAKINQIQSDESIVKIKLNKRVYKKLMNILPDSHKKILKGTVDGNGKSGFNINKYVERKERLERQNERKKAQHLKNKRKMSKAKRKKR